MNENLTIHGGLSPERIDRRRYTVSLADEMLRAGLLTDGSLERLQCGLYEYFESRIALYTGGESTSLQAESAGRLFASALYNLDLALLRLADSGGVSAAAERLLRIAERPTRGFEELGYEGLRLNRELMLKARSLLRRVKASRIDTRCIGYNLLLNRTLDSIVRGYDEKFGAAEPIAVSYPLPTLRGGLRGVSGIIRLLSELEAENRFVGSFPADRFKVLEQLYADELLSAVGEPMNLGRLCFVHAVLSLMAGRGEPTLPFEPTDAERRELARILADDTAALEQFTAQLHRFGGRAHEGYLERLAAQCRLGDIMRAKNKTTVILHKNLDKA